jgi:hypothetical protein
MLQLDAQLDIDHKTLDMIIYPRLSDPTSWSNLLGTSYRMLLIHQE